MHTDVDWPAGLRAEMDQLLRSSSPLLGHLDGELVDWGLGWAETALTPTSAMAGIDGTTSAGLLAAFADTALEVASNSYGRICLAIGIDAHHHRPAGIGQPLRARARETARHDRTATFHIDVVDISAEQDVALLASFQGRGYLTSRWHLPEESFPEWWRDRY